MPTNNVKALQWKGYRLNIKIIKTGRHHHQQMFHFIHQHKTIALYYDIRDTVVSVICQYATQTRIQSLVLLLLWLLLQVLQCCNTVGCKAIQPVKILAPEIPRGSFFGRARGTRPNGLCFSFLFVFIVSHQCCYSNFSFPIHLLSFVPYTWNDLSHRRPVLMVLTFPAAYHNRNVIFFS